MYYTKTPNYHNPRSILTQHFKKRGKMKKIILTLITLILVLNTSINSYSMENEKPPIENPRTKYTDTEILALQQIALAEAQNQGIFGMIYVMQTIINRVESDKFPNTIIEVIEQPGQFSTKGIYKSFTPTDESNAAFDCLSEVWNPGQLFFEVTYKGSWQSTHLHKLFTYNSHTFYM